MSTGIQFKNVTTRSTHVRCGGTVLPADLAIPEAARGIVLFVHGSGSTRYSPRNRAVAEQLQRGGMATCLFDLLRSDEETIDQRTGEFRFNIAFLARRVLDATRWIRSEPEICRLPVGYFGASTGAAAALVAAAERPSEVAAVVSRGGRPDLAGESLAGVKAPTLLIVGGNDLEVFDLNEQAMLCLSCEKNLQVVPGASHLFEEPGALEKVGQLARDWFERHLIMQHNLNGSFINAHRMV